MRTLTIASSSGQCAASAAPQRRASCSVHNAGMNRNQHRSHCDLITQRREGREQGMYTRKSAHIFSLKLSVAVFFRSLKNKGGLVPRPRCGARRRCKERVGYGRSPKLPAVLPLAWLTRDVDWRSLAMTQRWPCGSLAESFPVQAHGCVVKLRQTHSRIMARST